MNIQEVEEKAGYCLNCKNKPCIKGCPINTDIPAFISYIKNKEYEKAYEVVTHNNDLAHICALICPVEEQCEGSCIRGIKDKPVSISDMELFVCNWARENVKEEIEEIKDKNGIKIAVIGSGPAGLTCAAELTRAKFDVTIFEEYSSLGGILTYGIPEYRLKRDILNDSINRILALGINVKTNVSFGTDITIESLIKEGYKYIFLGIGAKKSTFMNINNVDCDGIYGANEFLRMYNEGKKVKCNKVIVVGGGNVAMDSARSAKLMGASDVTIVYRRREQDMPARAVEIEEAKEEDIQFIFQANVIDVLSKDKSVVGVKCLKTEVIEGKAKNIENTEFEIEADTIIMAIGATPDQDLLSKLNIQLNDKSFILIDEFGKTNIEGIYAGGDVTDTKATVCKAVYSGKQAAKEIIKESKKISKNIL